MFCVSEEVAVKPMLGRTSLLIFIFLALERVITLPWLFSLECMEMLFSEWNWLGCFMLCLFLFVFFFLLTCWGLRRFTFADDSFLMWVSGSGTSLGI